RLHPRHLLCRLRPLSGPVHRPPVVDVDDGRRCPRPVLPDARHEAPVAGGPGVGHDHPVGRLLLLAHPHEADLDHGTTTFSSEDNRGRLQQPAYTPGSPGKRGRLPPAPVICFIIPWTILNCLRRAFTSWVV